MGNRWTDFYMKAIISDHSSNYVENNTRDNTCRMVTERDGKQSGLHGKPYDVWENWVRLDGPGFEF